MLVDDNTGEASIGDEVCHDEHQVWPQTLFVDTRVRSKQASLDAPDLVLIGYIHNLVTKLNKFLLRKADRWLRFQGKSMVHDR